MSRFFIWIGYTEPFTLFSRSHLLAMLTLLLFYVALYFASGWIRSSKSVEKYLRVGLALTMILQEITLNVYRVQSGSWSFAESLPFHLCSFSIILGSIMLYKKSAYLFDICYYWSVGALMAILTPDLTNTDFPTFRYYQFFFSHGLIILSVLYMMFVNRYKPSKISLKRTFMFTFGITPLIALLNFFTGGNYFFIAYTPPTASLIDILGPWPLYLIPLSLIVVVVFSTMYLPFALYYRHSK